MIGAVITTHVVIVEASVMHQKAVVIVLVLMKKTLNGLILRAVAMNILVVSGKNLSQQKFMLQKKNTMFLMKNGTS
ncbi:MAG TPA: hypothetical protein DEP37_15470 [Algoriphagus sp.]|nr:hypothetical protein [Algoriphagus sp.]